MKKIENKLPLVNEKFYAEHMMKQMEIEKGKEWINSLSFDVSPEQRKEQKVEWERSSQR